MDFAKRDLDDDTLAFWSEVREFFDEHVTEEVLEDERRNGGGFNEALHLAMGKRGWVAPTWTPEQGGADLDPIRARILERELERSGAPSILASTTLLPPVAIRMFGSDELQAETLPGIAAGTIRISLGYTEPDCGSDLAAVKTRAVRDGDEWVITGQKMFTTGAQFCQYCFLLARTDVDAAKHKGLTVFVLPLNLPGVEITPIDTLGGERTNFVYLDDVRVSDYYRLGPVNEGWAVVSAPLAAEHGMGGDDDASAGSRYAYTTKVLLDAVITWAAGQVDDNGQRVLDDPSVRRRLAQVALNIEATELSPGPMGRILAADLMVTDTSALLEILGPAGVIPKGGDGAVIDGLGESTFRFAPGTGIYGGSTDIHRNLIAQHFLGLPRSTPKG